MKKRLLAAGLIALIVFALTACAKPAQVHTEPQVQIEQAPEQTAAAPAAAEPSPAMARTMMSLPNEEQSPARHVLPEEADYISAICAGDARVIFAATVASGEQTYTDAITAQTYSYDTYISRLYELHLYTRQVEELKVYTPWFEKQTDGQADICALTMLPEGGFLLAERIEQPVYDEQGVCTGINWMVRVMQMGAQGEVAEQQILDPRQWDELTLSAPKNVFKDREGNYYAADWENIYIWNHRGKLTARMENTFGGEAIQLADGRVGIVQAEDEELSLCLVDAENAQWGTSISLPAEAERLFTGGAYDLYYLGGGALYGYDAESETSRQIAELAQHDIEEEQIETVTADADGNVYLVLRTYTEHGYRTELAVLTAQE